MTSTAQSQWRRKRSNVISRPRSYYEPNGSYSTLITSIAQLSQRNRTAGWAGFGQKWKTIFSRQY